MLFDVGPYERALRDHLQSIGPHLVERTLDQPGADAFAAELWRHFGMDKCDDAVGDLVIGRGNMAVDAKFVTVMRRVLETALFISTNSSLDCPGRFFRPVADYKIASNGSCKSRWLPHVLTRHTPPMRPDWSLDSRSVMLASR